MEYTCTCISIIQCSKALSSSCESTPCRPFFQCIVRPYTWSLRDDGGIPTSRLTVFIFPPTSTTATIAANYAFIQVLVRRQASLPIAVYEAWTSNTDASCTGHWSSNCWGKWYLLVQRLRCHSRHSLPVIHLAPLKLLPIHHQGNSQNQHLHRLLLVDGLETAPHFQTSLVSQIQAV